MAGLGHLKFVLGAPSFDVRSAVTSTKPTRRPRSSATQPHSLPRCAKLSAYETGRTGWEQAMEATHPPAELRIEALQEPKPDDPVYQEDELRGPSRDELKRLLTPFIPRRSHTGSRRRTNDGGSSRSRPPERAETRPIVHRPVRADSKSARVH